MSGLRDRNSSNDASDAESEHDLSRRVHEQQNRPASIDMALNLERELDDEHESEHELGHGHPSGSTEALGQEGSTTSESDNGNRRVSFDPNVLQHIITNLRTELASAQQERDTLAETLENAPTREAELREALELLTERSAANEAELEQLRRKSQDDDDAIQMLRTKLEESRRALMRLQTESKRMSTMSHMSVDVSRANTLFGGGPSSSKRASFTPLTGSGVSRIPNHRRISSVSEPSFGLDTDAEPPSPTTAARTISWPDESDSASANANAKKSRRSSAFFGGMAMPMSLAKSTSPSPPTQQRHLASESSLNTDHSAPELEALRKEHDTMRAKLAAARQELAEAQEAREASEQCVVALRTFIAQVANDPLSGEGSSSVGILKLPPLPTEKNAELELSALQTTPNRKDRPVMGAGWSFGKLFRAESGGSASDSSAASPPAEGKHSHVSPSVSTPTTVTANAGNVSNSPSPSTATPGGAFSRTFGGFFSGRAPSITSMAGVTSPSAINNTNVNATKEKKLPPRPPTVHGQQEPTMNGMGSDEEGDSLESTDPPEPVSPEAPRESAEEIWVRNASSSAGSEAGAADRISLSSDSKGPKTDKERESQTEETPVQVEAA